MAKYDLSVYPNDVMVELVKSGGSSATALSSVLGKFILGKSTLKK